MPVIEFDEFTQVPLREMKRGLAKPIATIRLEPKDISKRLRGLRFESTEDDLDQLEAAIIRSNSGREFALVRHRHQPYSGTDILTDEHSGDLRRDLVEALRLLLLRRQELSWIHPRIAMAKRKATPAFMRLVQADSKLAAIVGSQPLPRSELTKKLWNYIKRHGRQDKKKKTRINADDKLRPVFNGKSQVSMFEMTKLVSKHLR